MNGSRVRTVSATSASVAIGKYGRLRLAAVRAGSTAFSSCGRGSAEAGASAMGGHRVSHELPHLLAEYLAVELPRVSPQLIGVPADVLGAPDGLDQRIHLLLREQHARLAINHRVER